MNPYLKNLQKIEFVVTNACTGRCKHCSEGDHDSCGERISPSIAANAVREIAKKYDIQTVMAFGGEPLLYPDAVFAIMSAALEMKVPKRQLITNGYFSGSPEKVRSIAKEILSCGVNDLLLSVDAFHQETIPLDTVIFFAKELKKLGVPVRLQPAWLVSREDTNSYNEKTKEILKRFSDYQIPESEGNIVFPEGNAKKYLAEYFLSFVPKNPYLEDPYDLKCISFSADGRVLGESLYEKSVTEILTNYVPEKATDV